MSSLRIFAFVAIDAMGNGVILPFLPSYAERMEASSGALGALIAARWLCQLVAAPGFCSLSGRIGRKRIILGGQLGRFASLVVFAAAAGRPVASLGRIVDGRMSGNLTAAFAIERSGGGKRRQAIGGISARFGLGTMV